jgi:hypothetical protein
MAEEKGAAAPENNLALVKPKKEAGSLDRSEMSSLDIS